MNQRMNRFGILLTSLSIVFLLLGMGGSWGKAYGQTAGPTPTVPAGSLKVVKSASPTTVTPGQEITFTIVVTNDGPVPLNNVTVTDTFVNFLEIVSVSTTKGTASTNGQNVRAEIGTLAPGESATVTVVTRVVAGTPAGSTWTNIANIGFQDPSNPQETVTASNPVAIGVGQSPPSGLPGTSTSPQINWLWIVLGLSCGIVGLGLIRRSRKTI